MSVGQRFIVSLKAQGFTRKSGAKQKAQILRLYNDGMHVSEIMEMFSAARPIIYKVIHEMKQAS